MMHQSSPTSGVVLLSRVVGAAKLLNQQRTFRVITRPRANMLHPLFPVLTEKIEPETVLIGIDLFDQKIPKPGPFCRVNQALENRFLNPLTIILADLGHPPQAPLTGQCFVSYIVCYQNKHLTLADISYLFNC